MFRNWGFLLGEIWVLLLLAALLGLFAGWLIWGRRSSYKDEADSLKMQLDSCRKDCADRDARIAGLEAEGGASGDLSADLEICRDGQRSRDAEIARLEAALAECQAAADASPAAPLGAMAAPAAAVAATDAGDTEGMVDYDGDGIFEGENEGTKPETLSAARGGVADDLKQIKGVGPKLEKLCNSMGFYHFDQIASWTDQEVAWVDANLEGFKGRVSRDRWVEQASVLAAGGETEFSNRVKKGDVY